MYLSEILKEKIKNIRLIIYVLLSRFLFTFLWQSKRNFMRQRGHDRITLRGQLGNLGESPPSVAPRRSWQTLCGPPIMELGCQIEQPLWWLKKKQMGLKNLQDFLFLYKSEILSEQALCPITFILLLLGGKNGSKNAPNLAQCACNELRKNRIVGKKAGKWWWGRWS